MSSNFVFIAFIVLCGILFIAIIALFAINMFKKISLSDAKIAEKNFEITSKITSDITNLREFLIQQVFKEYMQNSEKLETNVRQQLNQFKEHITQHLDNNLQHVNQHLSNTNSVIDQQLTQIRAYLDSNLSQNLSKTITTFNDIAQRLTLIDAAQSRINDLSGNIIELQNILSDKQSRGAFGEAQLETIIANILPKNHFEMQHVLSNNKRADCVVFLPQPTGKLAIDAKFPLESYRKIVSASDSSQNDKKQAIKQFKIDIKKHIQDIANKYIVPTETSNCAIMFIPAESIFAEIHSNHSDVIAESFKYKVWLTSPTTMMAILNTANSIIKDFARQREISLIQKQLSLLAKDFQLFYQKITLLTKHIKLANEDVDTVQISAQKIFRSFEKIEQVELPSDEQDPLELTEKHSN